MMNSLLVALQIKQANAGSTVTVVRVGSTQSNETLRTAVAVGRRRQCTCKCS